MGDAGKRRDKERRGRGFGRLRLPGHKKQEALSVYRTPWQKNRARDGIRTRGPHLGKVVLHP